MKFILWISLTIVQLVLLNSCSPKGFIRGAYDKDVNKENLLNDKWSESDMQSAVTNLVVSMSKHRIIRRARKPPIVLITRLHNKTSEHIDTQSIMDMVSVELMKTGDVVFVDKAAREDLANEYKYQTENTSESSRKYKGGQTGADLVLNGRIDSIVQEVGKDKTVYYKITLNLTNLKTGLKVWADQKQIRKKFKKKSLGW